MGRATSKGYSHVLSVMTSLSLLVLVKINHIVSMLSAINVYFYCKIRLNCHLGCFNGLTGSPIGYRSLASGFKPRPVYVRRCFIFHFDSLSLEVARPIQPTFWSITNANFLVKISNCSLL